MNAIAPVVVVVVVAIAMASACLSARAANDAPPAEAAHPTVASINLCADQLLLTLADRERILSITNLAHEPHASHHVARAHGLATNDGSAEPIVALAPDLVIVGEYSDRYTVRLLEARGLTVQRLPLADSIDDVFANLRLVGDWIGRRERADALVDALDARLVAVEQRRDALLATGAPLAAAVYDPNGYTVGAASLRGELLMRAGFDNVAVAAGIDGYGSLSLETLLRHRPDVLIDSPYSPGTWSRAQALATHPALSARGLDPDVVSLPSADTICGGPWTIGLVERLLDAHERLRAEASTSDPS